LELVEFKLTMNISKVTLVASNIPYVKVVHEGELYEKICISFGLETDYLYVKPNTQITLIRRYDVVSCLIPRWFHKFSLE
jgi:hypothetical protein